MGTLALVLLVVTVLGLVLIPAQHNEANNNETNYNDYGLLE
jgi:hypothetical protein